MCVYCIAAGQRKQSYQFTVHTESSWNSRNDWVMASKNETEMKEWIDAFKVYVCVCVRVCVCARACVYMCVCMHACV